MQLRKELEIEKKRLAEFKKEIKEYKQKLESFHLKKPNYSIAYNLFCYLFLRLLTRLYELKDCEFNEFIQYKEVVSGFEILKKLEVDWGSTEPLGSPGNLPEAYGSVPGSFKANTLHTNRETHRRLLDSIELHYNKTIIPTFLNIKKEHKNLMELKKLMVEIEFKEFGHLLDFTTSDFRKKFNFHFKHGRETNKEFNRNQAYVETIEIEDPIDEYKKSLYSILVRKLNYDLSQANTTEFIGLIQKTIEFQPKIQYDLINQLDISTWKECEFQMYKHQITDYSPEILFSILNQIKRKSRLLNIANLDIFTGLYYSIVQLYKDQLQSRISEYKASFFTINQTAEKYDALQLLAKSYESIVQIIDFIEQDTLDQLYINLSLHKPTDFNYWIDQLSDLQQEYVDLLSTEFYIEITSSSLIFDMEYKGTTSRDFVIILQTIKKLRELTNDEQLWIQLAQKYDLFVFDNIILKRYDIEGARQLEIDLKQFENSFFTLKKSFIGLDVLLLPVEKKLMLLESGIEGLSRNEVKKILSLFVLNNKS
ncbi:hypothetical protein HDV01_006112 [Terramyces sp. JEL0728]|nr:hypothetical protein HDV01_006112 [Terramyces sp. JEL0728]